MAVIETIWVDPPREKTEEEKAADLEQWENFQNGLLAGDFDLSGLESMSAQDIWNAAPNWYDQVREDTESFMYKEAMRSGGGMDNAYSSGNTGHFYIADDGLRYKKTMTWDENRQQMKVELYDDRVYRWQASDEHKRTHRDQAVIDAALGKEFTGGGGGGWYTEEEIKGAWDAGDMRQMENQGVTWDQYWGYVTGIDDLVNAGELDYNDASNWMENDAYKSLVEGLGIPLQFGDRGDVYNFNGFGYSRDYWSDKSDAGPIIKTLAAAAIGWAAGPAIAGGLGFTGGVAGGVANGVIGSAIGQGVTTGKIDPNSLVTAGIMGGLGAWFDDMVAGGEIVREGGTITNVTDNAIWGMSDMLGVDYETAAGILEGMIGGAIQGDSLEEIILGAVSSWGGSKVNEWVTDYFGSAGIDVSNWFREGETNIPSEALGAISEGAFKAALAGGMSEGEALSLVLDYFNEGGSLDFIWPDGVDMSWMEGVIDGLPDWEWPEWAIAVGIPGIKFPDIDIDVDLPDIPNPCGEGLIWDADLGDCIPDVDLPDVDLPDVDLPDISCPDGFRWDDTTGACIQIPNPCGEGMIWDVELGECVPELPEVDPELPDIECPEGFRWDPTRSECIQIPEVDIECPEGFQNVNGECLEIDVPFECPDGMRWDDTRGECIQIPEIEIECPEGFRWDDSRKECIQIPDIPIECPEGFVRDKQSGKCVDMSTPDIDGPDLPDVPSIDFAGGGGMFSPKNHEITWQTPQYHGPKKAQLTPYQSIINSLKNDKGMLS